MKQITSLSGILILLTLAPYEVNGYVHIECTLCSKFDGKSLVGELGTDLVFKYTINETTLHLFHIFYNDTNEFRWREGQVNPVSVEDTRLTAVETSKNNPQILEVTLKKLTWADNGAVFRYDARDHQLTPGVGQNAVVVIPKKEHSDTSEPIDSDVIVIGMISVIIVVMLILMLLLCKGIISLDGCLVLCGCGKKRTKKYTTHRRISLGKGRPCLTLV